MVSISDLRSNVFLPVLYLTVAADQLVNKVVWFFFMVIPDRQELSKCK